MRNTVLYVAAFIIGTSFSSCRKEGCTDPAALNYDIEAEKENGSCVYEDPTAPSDSTDTTTATYNPTPMPLAVPSLFSQFLPAPMIPQDNPQTKEGVALGKKLFYDPILSKDGTQACADCHAPEFSFTDSARFSTGIDGIKGTRNSMPIINVAWNPNEFFWDGRAPSVEDQAFGPVVNPIEMHNTWPRAVDSLQADADYPEMFFQAFGTRTIDSTLVVKALAQFERTLISGNSKFDKYLRQEVVLTSAEFNGYQIFMNENKGDCFHCHGSPQNPLWTDNDYHNNGLDATFSDIGLEAVTGDPNDRGKFKTPTIRNLVFTAPYMHDGRFATLEAVIAFYSTLPVTPAVGHREDFMVPLHLSAAEQADLAAFLRSLSDQEATKRFEAMAK